MSDEISYAVSFSPSPTPITLSVTVVSDELTATVNSVPDVGLSLRPSGNFVQKVISAVIEPLAALIVAIVKPKPRDMLEGKSKSIGKVPPYTIDDVKISASSLVLGGASLAGTDYLKATAKLSVAVTPPSGSNG